MKKITFTISFVLTALLSSAQLVNSGFENWTNKGSYDIPTGWISLDANYFPTPGIATVTKDNDAKSGSFAAKVKVAGTTSGSSGVAGILALGSDMQNFSGVPFTQRPTLLSVWLKYQTVGSDSIIVFADFTKFDQTSGSSLDIGASESTYLAGNQTTYKQFNFIIDWLNEENPDTLSLLIGIGDLNASEPIGTVGSWLLIDDIFVGYPTGFEDLSSIAITGIYPNPASDKVEIILSDKMKGASIQLIDMEGNTVYNGIDTK